MSSDTTHVTNALHNEFQNFLANITAEHPEPPMPPTAEIHALQTQVPILEGQLAARQQQFSFLNTGQQYATQNPAHTFQQRNMSLSMPPPTIPPPYLYKQ